MTYRIPQLVPGLRAHAALPRLRGQDALRIGGIIDHSPGAGSGRLRAFDAAHDGDLSAPLAPLCGLDWARPRIMGIVNVTPDSFSDGGRFDTLDAARAQAHRLVAEGADILDIGGESTRPGAAEVPVADEIARTAPLIRALRADGLVCPISIDTRKARVADAALEAGADIVNDVSGLTWDRDLARVIAASRVPVCLMHAQGTPQTMQDNPRYHDVISEVYDWLAGAIIRAGEAGIPSDRVIVDPGIGFGKTLAHNLALIRQLGVFHGLGCAILLGASRKRFIGELSGVTEAGARVAGSLAVAVQGAGQGAQILRVHDVAQTAQALALWRALQMEDETTKEGQSR
ncbi:MAG: dihydropteroate synthase [Rhodobacteraceae bacterium]|nr:MAG: dihydropteroate synthase [Paracoccaceae bacterium]